MVTRKTKKNVPFKNRSPSGWWIASYLQRLEYYDEDKTNLNRRCLAWENTILVRARSREQAYKKALSIGRLSQGSEAWHPETERRGAWRFEGLTSLLPVYEDLEDGCELTWIEHDGRTVGKIRSLAKRKRELEAFNDVE